MEVWGLMHIGLIGGIAPASTVFYYQGLVKAHSELGLKMALTIAHADVGILLENFLRNAKLEQAEVFSHHVDQLKSGGVEAVAVTSFGGHFCIDALKAISSLPIIDAVSVLDAHFHQNGIKRVGVIGTRAVMETKLYGGISSAEIITPSTEQYDLIQDTYIAMAMAGFPSKEQKSFFHNLGRNLCVEAGVDAVLLGGTDLFLAFGENKVDFPIIDGASVHIEEISKLSMGR